MPTKIASRAELDTAPPDLYELPETKHGTIFDPILGMDFEGEMKLFARVMIQGSKIPRSVDFSIRPDGCVVIMQWLCVNPATNGLMWTTPAESR